MSILKSKAPFRGFFLSFFFGFLVGIFVWMDSLDKYKVYFENIARQLNSIAHTDNEPHFESIHSSALFNGVQTKIKDRVLFLEEYSAAMGDNNDALTKTPTGAFCILKLIPGSGGYAAQSDAISWAEKECDKVLAKIKMDQENGVADVRHFKFDSVVYEPLSNMPLGWHGMRVQFLVTANTSLCYNGNDWLSTWTPAATCKQLGEYTVAQLLAGLTDEQINGILMAQNVLLLESGGFIELE